MTNNVIIENARLNLILENKITPDEEIHTFAKWKEYGYRVKKGEHAIAKFSVWKYGSKQVEVEDKEGNKETVDAGKCFMKNSCFFATHQVEK